MIQIKHMITYILTLFDTSLQQGKSVIRDGHWNIMATSWPDFPLTRQAPSLPVLTITKRPFMVVVLIWMVNCFLWWRLSVVPWSVHRMSLVENWSALFAPGNKNVKKKSLEQLLAWIIEIKSNGLTISVCFWNYI